MSDDFTKGSALSNLNYHAAQLHRYVIQLEDRYWHGNGVLGDIPKQAALTEVTRHLKLVTHYEELYRNLEAASVQQIAAE